MNIGVGGDAAREFQSILDGTNRQRAVLPGIHPVAIDFFEFSARSRACRVALVPELAEATLAAGAGAMNKHQ